MVNPDHLENRVKISGKLENIVIKGYRSGLTLIIPEEGPFDKHLQELRERLDKAHNFFKGAPITIQHGKRVLSALDQAALSQLLKDNGLVLHRFTEGAKSLPKNSLRNSFFLENSYIPSITINQTLRSGQKVQFHGNVIITGDVNPGAEIIAGGDIIVLGKLRGTVHAGAQGDDSARIIAFQLNPVQLRIAGMIARDAEKSKKVRQFSPEIAKIKGGMIMVERF